MENSLINQIIIFRILRFIFLLLTIALIVFSIIGAFNGEVTLIGGFGLIVLIVVFLSLLETINNYVKLLKKRLRLHNLSEKNKSEKK